MSIFTHADKFFLSAKCIFVRFDKDYFKKKLYLCTRI